MARSRRILVDAAESLRGLKRRIREEGPEVADRVLRPKYLKKYADGSTRASQILALFFLGPLIVVSLALIVALNQTMAGVFGSAWNSADPFSGPTAWLITAITLGALIMAAYTWFQFVRTSGFGFFTGGN